jgi:ATPase subunit of ABC transporter with duplicated ATPase domains
MAQADKMRAKATKTVAAQNMARRAERMLVGLEEVGSRDRVAKVRFPTPAAVRQDPADRARAVQVVRLAGDLRRRRCGRGQGPGWPSSGLNGAGKTTLLRMLAGMLHARHRRGPAGHGLRLGYYAQEHETLDVDRTILEHMRSAAPEQTDTELRKILGAFLFTGDDVDKPAGVLSGGEKTRLALSTLVCSGANVLLLDEPTNNLDPVSREQVLDAIAAIPARSCWSPTTRAPCWRSSPTGRSCCPTASRTPGPTTSSSSSNSPDLPCQRKVPAGIPSDPTWSLTRGWRGRPR